MVNIDKEIESLGRVLDSRDDVNPDYMFPELKELQTRVLSHHAQFERALEVRIINEVGKLLPPAEKGMKAVRGARILSVTQPLLDHISYSQKVEILEGYGDAPSELISALKKANKYRNEFAHPDGMELRGRYDRNTPEGKGEIRNLLRSLVRAHQELDKYFS